MNTALPPTGSAPGLAESRDGRSARGRSRAPHLAVLAAAALATGMLLGLPRGAAAEEGASLRIEPSSVTIDGGQTVTIDIVQSAAVETTGAQTNVVFDHKVIQIADMKPGPAYEGGLFLYGSETDGSSASLEATLASANETGFLKNVATLILPGSGSVPPGDNVFLTLTIQGVPGAGGTTPLVLRRIAGTQGVDVLDGIGTSMPVTAGRGSVTVRPSAGSASSSPSGGAQTPGASAAASAAPSSGIAGATAVPTVAAVAPASQKLDVGASTTVDLTVSTGIPATGVVATLEFDRRLLEITSIDLGPDWSQGLIVAGGGGKTLEQAIATANASGELAQVGVAVLPGTGSAPTGAGTFLKVTLKGLVDGTSTLDLTDVSVLDAGGMDHPATVEAAEMIVGSGGGGLDVLPIVLVVAVALVAIAGAYLFIRSRRYEED